MLHETLREEAARRGEEPARRDEDHDEGAITVAQLQRAYL
jgi:hypothetical protein